MKTHSLKGENDVFVASLKFCPIHRVALDGDSVASEIIRLVPADS